MIKGIHHISMKCGRADELTNVRKFLYRYSWYEDYT